MLVNATDSTYPKSAPVTNSKNTDQHSQSGLHIAYVLAVLLLNNKISRKPLF